MRSARRTPTKPWMMYYSTGCSHAPHHVAKEWADKYKGQFDDGWDRLRERTLERQKQLGIVPQDTELTERPEPSRRGTRSTTQPKGSTSARRRCSPGSRRMRTGTSGGCSTPSRRWATSTTRSIFYIWGDNGASMEGTVTGSFNELTFLNGVVLDADQQLKLIEKYGGIEDLGGDHTAPHFAAAWAHAINTPFQWGKQIGQPPRRYPRPDGRGLAAADQAGRAVRAPSSPTASTSARRSWRRPGIPEPTRVDGIAQEPMDGTSFLYSFDDADAPERHTTQYFEMFGSRAMYQDGWWAASRPDRLPWDFSPATLARFGPEPTGTPTATSAGSCTT